MKVIENAYNVAILANHYRAWRISWPYKSERYLVFGPKTTAEAAAAKFGKDNYGKKWMYKPSIREIKL